MKKSISLTASAMLSACSATSTPSDPAPPLIGLANPASVFCVQQGGKLRMVQTAQGEHGMCVLPDGREIEAWAYFHAHHPSAE